MRFVGVGLLEEGQNGTIDGLHEMMLPPSLVAKVGYQIHALCHFRPLDLAVLDLSTVRALANDEK